jgi:hypothetical protein
LVVDADEIRQRTVVSSFLLGGEEAAWELFHPPMIADAFAALPLPGAGVIGASAEFHIFFDVTFHFVLLNWTLAFLFVVTASAVQKAQKRLKPPLRTPISGTFIVAHPKIWVPGKFARLQLLNS